uniref:cytochrome c oxidase subunit III n=1 Tax=Neoseiulus californicus TaxID=84382 RepID=UPI0022DCE102|nr:cytochrome c oxidase subunit III [Neoseiulus californicus]UZU69618.1 cytochrome c oxidase subunit III [Neoseiulus californicus]WJN56898.1 cytochrome c oxidase subunit III [Neoseiulus californicus]WKV28868.1 cytochrome c oxidase subunit III [Neoseiulus californicus]
MLNKHSFHIVDLSPWPLISSFNIMNFLLTVIFWKMMIISIKMVLFCFFLILLTLSLWWRDVMRESSYQGHHTYNVYNSMKLSMILFIISEMMFFTSFFWSYFHMSLSPELDTGNNWPPTGVSLLNPYQTPLLNTVILLSSGASVTLTHYSILNKKYKISLFFLSLTILLGMTFSFFQFLEYNWTEFSMSDSSFGSTFFMTTGFHGMHVMIGTAFLSINIYRLLINQLNNKHHFSFEASAWYWHFVDVIWIYLYIFMYWWWF